MQQQLESVATYPTIKLALRLILLTLVRKSELIQATWDEVTFENGTWTIPKQRMKGCNLHVVYLSRQTLDIFVTLHACTPARRFKVRFSFSLRSGSVHVQCDLESNHAAHRGGRQGQRSTAASFSVHDLRCESPRFP